MEPKDHLIVALDVSDIDRASRLADELYEHVGAFKLGLEWMTAAMADMFGEDDEDVALGRFRSHRALVRSLRGRLMWDGKFADIPNTVGGATKNVPRLTHSFFTIHASIGLKAMEAVVENCGAAIPTAVTVLTSINDDDCESIFGAQKGEVVRSFADDALGCGIRALVCAPVEANMLRGKDTFDDLQLITPNTRPSFAMEVSDDQSRARRITIGEALKVDRTRRFVIGRPFTQPQKYGAESPRAAVQMACEEIAAAL